MALVETLFSLLDLKTILLGLSVLYLYKFWRNPLNFAPGPWGLPVIGCLPSLVLANQEMQFLFMDWSKKYGKIFAFNVCMKPVVVLNDYQSIHEGFFSPDIQSRPELKILTRFNKGRVFLSYEGVSNGSGAVWKEQRRFILSLFRSFGIGKASYEDQISVEVSHLIELLKTHGSRSFDPNIPLTNAIANIICSVSFGKRYEYDDKEFHQFLSVIYDMFKLFGEGGLLLGLPGVAYIPFGIPKRFIEKLNCYRNFAWKIFEEHEKTLDENNVRDIVDAYLIRMKNTKDVDPELFNFFNLLWVSGDLFIAGTETMSSTLCWAILFAITYPEIQVKVQDEMDSVVGKGMKPRLSDQANLHYVNAFIAETQRMGDVAPLGVVHEVARDTRLGDFMLPKGTMVQSNLTAVFRDPQLWKDPDTFNPGRFINEEGHFFKPKEFIPFSTGHRVCLGEQLARMELFIFITHLLSTFKFSIPEGTPPPSLEATTGITRTPKPFEITVECRE
ncbi:Cytochrome P450 2J5 [Holothuria leucospilota]|uniref:Cytochrome P450 2J5 n=1 Tax=Holothuria leucospilota TaxID=206669 RepID=A0A9Q1BET2_HOLLE|nr:Cytochrome P450 2J5 [Holothuria leucospilota]